MLSVSNNSKEHLLVPKPQHELYTAVVKALETISSRSGDFHIIFVDKVDRVKVMLEWVNDKM